MNRRYLVSMVGRESYFHPGHTMRYLVYLLPICRFDSTYGYSSVHQRVARLFEQFLAVDIYRVGICKPEKGANVLTDGSRASGGLRMDAFIRLCQSP